jgi:hypothetical protein
LSRPRVLIVDDQPATAANGLAQNLEMIGVSAEAMEPDEVDERGLLRADLVLVDFKLENWDVASGGSGERVARSPRDGLALAAVLASRLRADERVHGIALYSAELDMLVRDFSSAVTEHAAARINGIDWAFQKEAVPDVPPTARRVAQFVEAIQRLSDTWGADGDDGLTQLKKLLAVPETGWAEVATRDILAAQPPIHQFAESSRGITVIRWLAQRVLPYPTFLLDSRQLAAACGARPESLEEGDIETLDAVFDQGLYRGSLDEFLGPRWWKPAVRRKLRDWTDTTQPSTDAVEKLGAVLGRTLAPLDPVTSVLTVNKTLQESSDPIARERGVRVRPDDWPIFAEPAWIDENLVKANAGLRSFVEPADLARLDKTP